MYNFAIIFFQIKAFLLGVDIFWGRGMEEKIPTYVIII